MNRLREYAEYFLVKGFFVVLRFCPASLIYGICRLTGRLFYAAAKRRREVALANLALAFPEKSRVEHIRIAKQAFDHFGQSLAESAMILAGKLRAEQLLEMVDSSEVAKLRQLEDRSDKGLLLITGHLGNFELLAHTTGLLLERSGHVVARQGTNRLVDEKLVTPSRQAFGNRVIYKDRALPRIIRALKKGDHAGLLIDVKTTRRHGLPATFFGKPVLAVKSSAYLQIKLGVQVVPVALFRTGPRQYKLIVRDPIEWSDNGQSREDQIAELAQRHQDVLEDLVRNCPEQWFWMHDRWNQRKRRKRRKPAAPQR